MLAVLHFLELPSSMKKQFTEYLDIMLPSLHRGKTRIAAHLDATYEHPGMHDH